MLVEVWKNGIPFKLDLHKAKKSEEKWSLNKLPVANFIMVPAINNRPVWGGFFSLPITIFSFYKVILGLQSQ